MDITDLTDINQLKALAYDQMVALERAQRNLNLVSRRIADLEAEHLPTPPNIQQNEAV